MPRFFGELLIATGEIEHRHLQEALELCDQVNLRIGELAVRENWMDKGQVREVLERLRGLVVDGLKHGYFDYTINCEIGKGNKRQLVIRAGKSHKFTIPEDELPR